MAHVWSHGVNDDNQCRRLTRWGALAEAVPLESELFQRVRLLHFKKSAWDGIGACGSMVFSHCLSARVDQKFVTFVCDQAEKEGKGRTEKDAITADVLEDYYGIVMSFSGSSWSCDV